MTQIIAISGKKQSGKTTLCNFLHGHEMKRNKFLENFSISPEGQLLVNALFFDENGSEYMDMGVLDLQQSTREFYEYASSTFWPHIRAYNFADSLKEICVMLFNIPPECIYGTDDQKNQLQNHLRWENMPGITTEKTPTDKVDAAQAESLRVYYEKVLSSIVYHEPGPMTAREFMQYLGTDIMRKIYEPIWVQNCLRRIEEDSPEIAVIADCRFINEIEHVRAAGGKVVRLTRSLYTSYHQSEIDADNYENFDAVIDNRDMQINESCNAFLDALLKLGVVKPIRSIGKFTTSIK
jgi:hypothetical protein